MRNCSLKAPSNEFKVTVPAVPPKTAVSAVPVVSVHTIALAPSHQKAEDVSQVPVPPKVELPVADQDTVEARVEGMRRDSALKARSKPTAGRAIGRWGYFIRGKLRIANGGKTRNRPVNGCQRQRVGGDRRRDAFADTPLIISKIQEQSYVGLFDRI